MNEQFRQFSTGYISFTTFIFRYFATRSIQGRINDICLLVTLSAARSHEYGEVDGITGYQTRIEGKANNDGDERDAKTLVQDVTRLLRMSHTFFWAVKPICSDGLSDVLFKGEIDDIPTESDGSRFGPLLLSPQGLEMLVKYGQLTRREVNALKKTNLAPSQYPYVLMEWAGLRIMSGLRKGELVGGPGMYYCSSSKLFVLIKPFDNYFPSLFFDHLYKNRT